LNASTNRDKKCIEWKEGRERGREGEGREIITYLNETKALGPIELVLDDSDRDDAAVRPKHALDVLLAHLLEWKEREGGREGKEGGSQGEFVWSGEK